MVCTRVERIYEYRMASMMLMAEVSAWRLGTEETEVRLDIWCECGLEQQRDDGEAARQYTKDEKE